MRVRVETGALLWAVNVGKHLQQAEIGIRYLASEQRTDEMLMLSLYEIKRSLRAAVREVEMIEAVIRNAPPRED